ncbi:MAG: excinuclease ABC subunit C [Spirochaetes bacterium GWF1_51_8]|nr:MAG: excinuclease ABC subunit C [Spirochaetes bacterium GWF1_51_8]
MPGHNGIEENKGYVTPAEVSSMPPAFGVYLMKNASGLVIYVGKAINLRKRVTSYFQKNHPDIKTRALVENIALIDYITVGSEMEALILEANLIKKYHPKYNVDYKDNKFYPFITVTVQEEYPRIFLTRDPRKDGSLIFGPYTSAQMVRRYIDMVQRLFKIRVCRELPKHECLYYHIHRCSAPCIQKVTKDEYRAQAELATQLLRGEIDDLLTRLEAEMRDASKELLFEKAQAVKEKIEAVRFFVEGQHVHLQSRIDADFIAAASKMGKILYVVNIIRQGKMIGKRSYTAAPRIDEDEAEMLQRFVIEYFRQSDGKAEVIVVEPEYAKTLAALNGYFSGAAEAKVRVTVPVDDDQRALVRIARENAELHLAQVLSKVDRSESLKLLQEALGTDRLPMRIEGFDIANILGQQAVAAMVSFYGGDPDKPNYRHFNIRSKTTPDDFTMMREAVYRRYKRLRDEGLDFPDLILIDGGKGQLHAALDAVSELGVKVNVASLAKRNEEIYLPGADLPLVLEKNSPALHVLQRVRDESHRFSNKCYNKLKRRSALESVFDDIDGIGGKRKSVIVKKFLRREVIENLTLNDLTEEGIPTGIAEKVYNSLKALYNKSSND